MVESTSAGAAQHIAFETFGVRIRVTADAAEVLERIPALLPPGAHPCAPSAADESFGILADPSGGYQFTRGDSPVTTGVDLDFALMLLENQLRIYVALNARDRIFIHAGVVAYDGRAILIPGRSFAGKTTLVVALVRAGATYYSDEFAVIDAEGLVHPYSKPLSVRDDDEVQGDHDVGSFGGVAGEEPVRVGAVVVTSYQPGGEWNPARLSPGKCALAMLSNTVAAMARAEESMRTFRLALEGAVLLESVRGEAAAIADQLLESVSGEGGTPPA